MFWDNCQNMQKKRLYIVPDKNTNIFYAWIYALDVRMWVFFNIKLTVKSKPMPKIYPTNLLSFLGLKRDALNLTISQ